MNRRTVLATVAAALATPATVLATVAVALAAPAVVLATLATPAVVLATPTASSAASAAGPPAVTMRVEGLKRTLLSPKLVTTGSGWMRRYGAPKGACPDKSAQGALDVATRHHWGGMWDGGLGSYEVLSILGETHTFTSKYFWELFVNNVSATVGACELHLHRGEQLLFAAVPLQPNAYPTATRAPANATVGIPFSVKVVWFNAKGRAEPLANARVTGSAVSTSTNGEGVATVTARHSGPLVLHAEHKRSASAAYVRAAPVTVGVS